MTFQVKVTSTRFNINRTIPMSSSDEDGAKKFALEIAIGEFISSLGFTQTKRDIRKVAMEMTLKDLIGSFSATIA